jgi:hypothetical protein
VYVYIVRVFGKVSCKYCDDPKQLIEHRPELTTRVMSGVLVLVLVLILRRIFH